MCNIKIKPAFNKNNIAVVLSSDGNFVPYLAATIKSIFDNSNPKYNYDILVFDGGISEYQKSLISLINIPNSSIRYIDVKVLLKDIDSSLFQTKGIWSVATFYRLFIPQIMSDYERVLYLDCDILVKDSLVDLFKLDMNNNKIAAVVDYMAFLSNLAKARKHANKIGIKNYKEYFNAGVVLFRPNKIDYIKFKNDFLNILEAKKLSYLDQDVLNIIFEGKTLLLDLSWNYQCSLSNKYPELKSNKTVSKAESKAKIIHYTSYDKPWINPSLPLAYDWWKVARTIPFYEEIIYKNTKTSNQLLHNLMHHRVLACKFMLLKLLKLITIGQTNRVINKAYVDIKNQYFAIKKVFK